VTKEVCNTCGWKREDAGTQVSAQIINHDHMTLIHIFNVARSLQFRLVTEWARLERALAPHLRRLLTVADVGPRKGELLNLEWSDVDLRRKEFRRVEPRMVRYGLCP